MTLDNIAKKHGINSNIVNSKDDGLPIAVKSVQQLVAEMQRRKVDNEIIEGTKKLGEFLNDISKADTK